MLVCAAATHGAAAADDDPLAATVKVDATSENAAKARELARIDGQRRALTEIAGRLSGGAAAKLPKLDDNTITNLVASFEVANERMSAVHYVADYTFHFRPAELRRALHLADTASADAPAAGGAGKSITVLPVLQSGGRAVLWDDPNPWRSAWAQHAPAESGPRLAVPLGDSSDIMAIDADKAKSGSADALAAIAKQNGGDEAIVALAAARGAKDQPAGLDVTVKRYRAGQPVDTRSVSFTPNPGENTDDFLLRAANTVAGHIETGWKKEPPGKIDQQGTLTAAAPITSLDDWVQLRDRLTGVGAIRKVELMTLSRQEATVEIQYVGSVDQLKASLADAHLDLVQGIPAGDKSWRLARSSPAPTAR